MKKVNKYIRSAITVVSVGWLAFTVSHIILTGKIYLWNFPSSLPTFFFILIPLFLLTCMVLWKKRKLSCILIVVLSLLLGITQLDINIFRMKTYELQTNEYTPVKIFNWNTNCWDQHKNRKQFFDFLKKQQADIYILQEYLHLMDSGIEPTQEDIERLKLFSICPAVPGFPAIYQPVNDIQVIKKEFSGYYVATDNQFVIISRFPIKASHVDCSQQYSVSDIDIQGRLVRFFNVHMLLHIEPGSPFKPYFYEMLNRRFKARQLGFKNLKEDIKKTNGDYFISGDFNSTKAMGAIEDLLKENVDAARYSNELIPMTFEFRGLKFWRFDYALVPKNNKNIMIKSFRSIGHEGLSDHNPLSLVLSVKNNDLYYKEIK
jgi:endonuclease/exonuclease/phosphatase family metal-dependent hydrolase